MDFFRDCGQLVADFGGRDKDEMGVNCHRAVTGQVGGEAESAVGHREKRSPVQAPQKIRHG
jgi:hypothetical protein